jgi:vacuolar protein sorting-associated protein 26
LGFGPVAELVIELDGAEKRAKIRHPADKTKELPLFKADEPVTGKLRVIVPAGKKADHNGLKLAMLGVIETPHERQTLYEFTTLVRELEPSGGVAPPLEHETMYAFDFTSVTKQHDSYYGRSVRLRYVLRATLARSYASNVVVEQDLWVQSLGTAPEINNTIKMEVGIEECLHIEFEYNKSKYHLQDAVVGKVFFLLVRIKIKHMELAIIRREIVTSGSGTSGEKHSDSETITKFEIMDGAPIKGESVPVRLYLAPYALTPTFRNVQNKFSVKYFLNLVLVDEEDRRYFKQQEITLWRKTYGA